MAKIEFPHPLKSLLEESNLQGPIRILADRVGEILADNKLLFFPDYTDHGTDHVNRVLESEVELVPKEVWDQSKEDSNPRLLRDADAAVIIGATLLHDIAMHLRPDGFRTLIRKESPFQPLPWFKDTQEDHRADRPWNELWDEYVREARRFNDRALGNIVGLESVRGGWKFDALPEDTGQWSGNHYRIVGEFIRRHHARLAHEIAIFGFPSVEVGSSEGQFPAMGKEEGHLLMKLADLIGLTARSHGTSLRACKAYLDYKYAGTPSPMGTAVLYPMALLRIADYLQIEGQRAPAVLLQLRNPPSPISVQEWKKHFAVQSINPATDPRGKMVTVNPDNLSLELYLQLSELLVGLQAEMDHSTAVLDEIYGALSDLRFNQLSLATCRVYSNLKSPAFRGSLTYVPERTGFSADPNLLALLIEPLYGREPGVGVRELMQNALDAVSELEAWCVAHGKTIESLDLPDQEADVLIEFIERDDKKWLLRVRDRGIGMRSETIQKYFLRAGASFRQSSEWEMEFLDDERKPRVLRAGRFGVGAFAIFLLGPSFRMWTRYAGAEKSMGYSIDASIDSQLIEIRREDNLPVGTTIEVQLIWQTVAELFESDYPRGKSSIDWFCWDWPKVSKQIVRGATLETLDQRYAAPLRKAKPGPEWSVISPKGFEKVYWTFGKWPCLMCNGLRIEEPHSLEQDDPSYSPGYNWPKETQLKRPSIAVFDNAANLPLTTQRYRLSQQNLPFIDELARDVTLSFIAHALVCGPTSPDEIHSDGFAHPLRRNPLSTDAVGADQSQSLFRWCATLSAVIPVDPWLYSLLQSESCIVYGVLCKEELRDSARDVDAMGFLGRPVLSAHNNYALLRWDALTHSPQDVAASDASESFLAALGFQITGCEEIDYRMVASIWDERSSEHSEGPSDEWGHYVTQNGAIGPPLPLEDWITRVECNPSYVPRENVYYIAQLCARASTRTPESMIAKIWNECLGPTTIPFDPAARKELIENGRQHPKLKRHIEAWEEMKPSKGMEIVGSVT